MEEVESFWLDISDSHDRFPAQILIYDYKSKYPPEKVHDLFDNRPPAAMNTLPIETKPPIKTKSGLEFNRLKTFNLNKD